VAARPFATIAVSLILALGIWLSSSTAHILPTDAKEIAAVSADLFGTWFDSGLPAKDGLVKPPDSVNFSGNPNLKNLDFYRWSEQMFLWLTSPVRDEVTGEMGIVLNSKEFFLVSALVNGKRTLRRNKNRNKANNNRKNEPYEIPTLRVQSAETGPQGLPILFDKFGLLHELASPAPTDVVQNESGKQFKVAKILTDVNGQLIFNTSDGAPIEHPRPIIDDKYMGSPIVQEIKAGGVSVFLDRQGATIDIEEGQGDLAHSVLLSQSGSLVYYMISVNDVYEAFFRTVQSGEVSAEACKNVPQKPAYRFPTTQPELNKVIAYAASHNKPIGNPNALCIEVKTSWVEADSLPDKGAGYIKMKAKIPTYDTGHRNHWIYTGESKIPVPLALVGMNIAGSARGHPEMIWAAFEHLDNTPNAPFSYVNKCSKLICADPGTGGTWVLCHDGAKKGFNTRRQKMCGDDIVSTGKMDIGPTNTIRYKPFGAACDKKPNPSIDNSAESNTQIISINNSIREQLDLNDVRRKYFMLGATWSTGGANPMFSFNGKSGNIVGASQLANSTMETYTEKKSEWKRDGSCFACHRNDAGNGCHFGTTDISRIFCDLE
jgi:hypothetical protein